MSVRARSSTAGPSGSAIPPLPPYQPLEYPMNDAAIRALTHLQKSHNHRTLEQHLRQAAQHLNDNAAAINDRLTERKERDHKRRQKHADSLTHVDEQRARHLEDFDTCVTAMTKRMEEAIRKTIDAKYIAGAAQEEIQHIGRQAVTNTREFERLTQTQRRRDRDEDDDDDDEQTEYDPTLPGNTQQSLPQIPVVVPHDLFQQRLKAQVDDYQAMSHAVRYSEQADYIGFKEAVHQASFPEGSAPPLPHRSTWFTSTGAPAPGVTQTEGDSDDDIAIASERISTKCPLTLQEFRDPVTSAKCPHSFEKTAILELIEHSNTFAGGSNRRGAMDGIRTVMCPVSGCSQMLIEADLRPDTALIRKIQRIQRQRAARDEDSDDEGMDDSHAQVIPSDDIDGYEDVDEPASQTVVPKMERLSGAVRRPGVGSSRFGGRGFDGTQESTAVDLGSRSDDDDE